MIKNMTLLLTAVVISLAAVEGYVRFHPELLEYGQKFFLNGNDGNYYANCYPTPPRDGFSHRLNNRKNCTYLKKRYDLSEKQLVTLAVRAPFCLDYDIPKRKAGCFPDRSQELFIIGDSFAFGEGVPFSDTIACCLARRLRQVNVRNFAESAAGIEDVVQQAQQVCKGHKTPRIVYFFNLNDPLKAPALAPQKRRALDFQNLRYNDQPAAVFPGHDWTKRLKLLELIFNHWYLWKQTRISRQYYQDIYFSPVNATAMGKTLAQIREMKKAVEKQKGRFLVVIWPLLHKDKWGNYPFEKIHAKVQTFCNRHEIPCVDGLQAFAGYRSMKSFRVHKIDYHPNARANRILADYLANTEQMKKCLE